MAILLRRRNLLVLVLAMAAALLAPMVAAQAQPTPSSGRSGHPTSSPTAAHQHQPPKPKHPKPPKKPAPKPPRLGAPSPAQNDISSTMPRTMRDDLTGDFLGRGYDQRMRAEGGNLNIYDSPSRGGTLLQSTPLDLHAASDGGVLYSPPDNSQYTFTNYTWAKWVMEKYQYCDGCFETAFTVYHFNTVNLARNSQHLFVTGTTGNRFDDDQVGSVDTPYRDWLYELPADGSCASETCAQASVALPDVYNLAGAGIGEARAITVTSLAAGYVGTHPYLAVGLSDDGVQIYDVSGSTPQLTATFAGMATGDGSQTPPTALAWDPSGSGLLAIGVASWGGEGFFVHVDANGVVQPNWQSWTKPGGLNLEAGYPLSAAIGQGPSGEPVVAFGMNYGGLVLVDPTVTTQNPLSQTSTNIAGIVAVNPIPRIDGTSGAQDYAVSDQPTTDVTQGDGALLRWDGTSTPLTYQTVSPVPNTVLPGNTLLTDRDSFRAWYPGLKEGRFTIQNNSGEPISVSLHPRSDAGYGCWYAPSWADAPAFPSQSVTVAAGQSSAEYTMGAYTAGSTGGCGATDVTGTWRGYLAVTPVDRPADVSLVDVQLKRNMTVDVSSDQVGSSTAVSITNDHQQVAAFGLWTITVDTPSVPSALTAPTVAGQRLTAAPLDPTVPDTGLADDPHRPVYRFDVTGAQWTGVAATGQLTAVVPTMTAEGCSSTICSSGDSSWKDLGQLMPTTTPTVTGSTVTLGEASFYWQEDPGGQPLTAVRVMSGGLPSNVVYLARLDAPAVNGGPGAVGVAALALTSATTNAAMAAPRANGVDQAPMSLRFQPSNAGTPVSLDDPRYNLVYYRDSTSFELVTGLYRTGAKDHFQGYVSITPWRGAYPNDGIQSATRAGVAATSSSTSDPTVAGTRSRSRCRPHPHPGPRTSTCPPCPTPKDGRHHRCSPGGGSGGGGGLGSSGGDLTTVYLVTTNLSGSVYAVMDDSGTPTGFPSSGIAIAGDTSAVTPSGGIGSGLLLNGCPSGPCTLVTPTGAAPGLYQAGSSAAGPAIGLLFGLQATTAQSILPLELTTDHPQHPLAQSPITITNETQAQLSNSAAFWPLDKIDTNLLTAGTLVHVSGAPQ